MSAGRSVVRGVSCRMVVGDAVWSVRSGAWRILVLLRRGRMYTRQLLGLLSSWERGQQLLAEAEARGLIRRYAGSLPVSGRPVVWNELTERGRLVADALSSLDGGE